MLSCSVVLSDSAGPHGLPSRLPGAGQNARPDSNFDARLRFVQQRCHKQFRRRFGQVSKLHKNPYKSKDYIAE